MIYVSTDGFRGYSFEAYNRNAVANATKAANTERLSDERGERVRVTLGTGKQIQAESALHNIGRTGATGSLNLEEIGLTVGDRELISVNENFQTKVDHIYAVGDAIGFSSLASTSMEQGRIAYFHAFGKKAESVPNLLPYGIYTIPEISVVGQSEETLTEEAFPTKWARHPIRKSHAARSLARVPANLSTSVRPRYRSAARSTISSIRSSTTRPWQNVTKPPRSMGSTG